MCTCRWAGGNKIDLKIGLQDVVWIYMALVRDQGQTVVTFELRRSWGLVDMLNSYWLLKKDSPYEVCSGKVRMYLGGCR